LGRALGEANPLTLAYASLLAIAALQARGRAAINAVVAWAWTRCLAMVATAPAALALALRMLPDTLPFDLRAVVAAAVAVLVAEATFWAVDVPARRVAGGWTTARRTRRGRSLR
jgi:hypothetical protein